MANPRQQNIDEEDPDILALREMALSTIASKDKKRALPNGGNLSSQPTKLIPFHHDQYANNMSHGPILHDYPPHQMSMNGMGAIGFNGQRMGYSHSAPEMSPAPMRPHMYNQMYSQDMMPRTTFAPRQPPFQTHVNPHFIPHQGQRFIPPGPELSPMTMEREEGMPMMTGNVPFQPTPPSRLSPRSAQFVAENEKHLQRQRRRSLSSGRPRSPYNYRSRSRSRSPRQKTQISHIARKRTRSKTPENGCTNKFTRKNSPRRRSQEKRISPKFSDDRTNRNRNNKQNGNRDRHGNERRELDRRPARMYNSNVDSDKKESAVGQVSKKSPSPVKEVKKREQQDSRKKTEQELEDELLASTDDSDSESVKADDDTFKVTLDEKDLDFLDDDEEESENEGRFKSSKPSESKPTTTTTSFKSSFSSRSYDKSKNFNHSRNDYNRRNFSDDKRDKPTDVGKRYSSRKKTPEARKSPEARKAPAKEPSKIVIINKEKVEPVKEDARKKTPLFKATFKTVDSQSDDKKKDEEPKKDDRIRLVRGTATTRESGKSGEATKTEKPKEDAKRPAIMKRLGGYIKESVPKVTKQWAKEQAP